MQGICGRVAILLARVFGFVGLWRLWFSRLEVLKSFEED